MSDYIHKKKKIPSKTKKKKKEVEEQIPDTESSDEELDLTKECHPIAHYINDRAEMISQMFSVIKGNKLKAMLPPILKDYDVENLKLKCLDQLLGMSEKRITCILEGEILDSSSESEVLSDVESNDSQSDRSSQTSEKGSIHTSSSRRKHKRKSDTDSVGRASKMSKKDQPAPEQGKTLLEILELEMRARAIRALLKQGGDSEKPSDPAVNTGDVVDLTADEDFPTIVKIEPPSTEQERSFEDKVVKSSTTAEKSKKVHVAAKKQRLIAEQELRNKLIKKKTYRTRKQRIENMEEEAVVEPETENVVEEIPEVKVKEEPTEIVIEDPEEGEVSSEEEILAPVRVKEEKQETPEPQPETDKQMDGERIMAMDDGEFLTDENVQWENVPIETAAPPNDNEPETVEDEPENVEVQEDSEVTQDGSESNQSGMKPEMDPPIGEEEEATWRARWLKKDGVQMVVRSSKICGLVKKRLKNKKAVAVEEALPATVPEEPAPEEPPVLMEGSVSEYEKLPGKNIDDSGTVPTGEEQSGEPGEVSVDSGDTLESGLEVEAKSAEFSEQTNTDPTQNTEQENREQPELEEVG